MAAKCKVKMRKKQVCVEQADLNFKIISIARTWNCIGSGYDALDMWQVQLKQEVKFDTLG